MSFYAENDLGDATSLFKSEAVTAFRDITDFTKILELPIVGCDSKIWVSISGVRYLLKTEESKSIPEYVGSRFFQEIGIPTQNAELVYFNGRLCCLLSDIVNGNVLRTFKCIHDSSVETTTSDKFYTFSDIEDMLDAYCKADNKFILSLKERFFKTFVVDAILANRDRHGGNWGYLCNGTQRYLCNVFDNGASLFPGITEFDNLSKQQWYSLVIDAPRSQVQLVPGKKNTFYRIFNEYRDYIDTSWISVDKVIKAIDAATQGLDKDRAEFYKKLVWLRYKCIIEGCEFNEAFRLYRS